MQDDLANPFGMDEDCQNCPELAACRERILHGYGDAGGDIVFVGESPTAGAEANGVPFTGGEADRKIQYVLGELGLSNSPLDAAEPDLQNVYLTYLTRCRHPDRAATDEEVANCEPYRNAELRMINPELIVPVGQRALEELALEYTTRAPESFDAVEEHATTVRGRGFELLPMKDLEDLTDADVDAFLEHVREDVFSRDYRQTKGRQSR